MRRYGKFLSDTQSYTGSFNPFVINTGSFNNTGFFNLFAPLVCSLSIRRCPERFDSFQSRLHTRPKSGRIIDESLFYVHGFMFKMNDIKEVFEWRRRSAGQKGETSEWHTV